MGHGSQFHFTASFGEAAVGGRGCVRAPYLLTAGRHPGRNRRSYECLLAEDNAVNQKIAFRVLEKQGHHVTVAANGRLALAALDQATSMWC